MRCRIGWSIVCVVFLGATLGWNQTSDYPQRIKRSFLDSCWNSPSVGVAASTPHHDGSPAVKLSLIDPKGQVQPRALGKRPIPRSAYGEVSELSNAPARSRALAIEVCDAAQGGYSLRIEETGGQPYAVMVTGNAPNNSETLILHHQSKPGRVWDYRFVYWVKDKEAKTNWLDENGRVLNSGAMLEIPEW